MNYGREVVEEMVDELGIEIVRENSSGWAIALCPLHDDSKPSFSINMEEGGWKCHSASCGESSNDLAQLIHLITGKPIKSIRRSLIMKIPLGEESIRRALFGSDKSNETRYQEPLFYERSRVPAYILERGFDIDFLKKWEVGYDSELNAAVIPVRHKGKLIALIRRLVDPEPNGAKYIYTGGFEKSNLLFGLEQSIAMNAGYVILTEGALDCLWLHQYGYPGAAILGSSMSEVQATLVKRSFWDVTLGYDNDKSGIEATESSIGMLAGLSLKHLALPSGRDIQDCSEEQLKRIIENARPILRPSRKKGKIREVN